LADVENDSYAKDNDCPKHGVLAKFLCPVLCACCRVESRDCTVNHNNGQGDDHDRNGDERADKGRAFVPARWFLGSAVSHLSVSSSQRMLPS